MTICSAMGFRHVSNMFLRISPCSLVALPPGLSPSRGPPALALGQRGEPPRIDIRWASTWSLFGFSDISRRRAAALERFDSFFFVSASLKKTSNSLREMPAIRSPRREGERALA